MYYPPGQNLESVIGSERFNALETALSGYQVPAEFDQPDEALGSHDDIEHTATGDRFFYGFVPFAARIRQWS